MSTLGKDLGEFMNFLGGIVTKEAEKKLSKELDKENRKLESKLQKTSVFRNIYSSLNNFEENDTISERIDRVLK